MTTTAKKKIFISDIHLGDSRSFEGPNPYGRCRKNISYLLKFLNDLLQSDDVAEVVILGDLFDRWVIPADQDPLISFQEIFAKNLEVITALHTLAAKVKLTYVPGNHDMNLPIEKQAEIEQFMKSQIHGNICYKQVYKSGTIVGEHGHRYTLFNAHYPLTDQAPSSLPIGYFISRLEATKYCRKGERQHFPAILKNSVLETILQANFITAFFTKVADDAEMKSSGLINMNRIPGFPATVEEIGKLYKDLTGQWQVNQKNLELDWPKFDWPLAVAGDINRLLLAAAMVYFSPGSSYDIVIFGHTHEAKLLRKYNFKPLDKIHDLLSSILDETVEDLIGGLPDIDKDKIREILKEAPIVPFDLFKKLRLDLLKKLPFGPSLDPSCRSIYANCGTWVDDEPCTYVETQEDFEHGRHYVRLRSYHPAKKLLQEAYVNLNK